ncbi:hypothetical protein PR048_029754 [Dryococelus australis]|uniref:Uncharacterized protein n=1 Tax=Dryococelus australis TaxID=614101 RepID=A0ABQ9GEA3_9NEOP|nr:hypothetical protein PR048_029754 [Dryococelus australis]
MDGMQKCAAIETSSGHQVSLDLQRSRNSGTSSPLDLWYILKPGALVHPQPWSSGTSSHLELWYDLTLELWYILTLGALVHPHPWSSGTSSPLELWQSDEVWPVGDRDGGNGRSRESPQTSGIAQHDSRLWKSVSGLARELEQCGSNDVSAVSLLWETFYSFVELTKTRNNNLWNERFKKAISV